MCLFVCHGVILKKNFMQGLPHIYLGLKKLDIGMEWK